MKRKKNDAKATLSNPDRRRLLGSAAFLGGAALAGGALSGCLAPAEGAVLKTRRPDAPYGADDPENLIYSVCLNCNTGCGVKCRIEDGVLTKLDGNPWNPWTMVPHLSMKAGLDEGAHRDGALCPKGQAAVQTVYDPYRLRTVLKRAGQRGENKWMTVPFARAIEEIVEGGRLFAHVAGEENREVEGLRSLMALRDGAASGEMAAAVKAIWDEKDAAKKKELVEKFNTDFAAHRDALIDPAHPDLGPRNNQFTIAWGRLKGGRSDFIKRFGAGFGTTNLHGHTTVCQGSLYFTCKAISEQYTEEGKFGGGQKFYWQGDIENSRTILFVGANLFEANYGPTNRTVRLTENRGRGPALLKAREQSRDLAPDQAGDRCRRGPGDHPLDARQRPL
jgi:anaerobic selenocysteine-containing dehydrogenase